MKKGARITSGVGKNKKLEVPEIDGIRVAQDVVKQAVFSILEDKVVDAECLDLYAGSGSFGVEALSRGAKSCVFVDANKKAEESIKKNVHAIGEEYLEKAEIIIKDAVKYAANASEKFDIIFVDPFFSETKHKFLMENLEQILKENGVIIFTHGKENNMEDNLRNTNLEIVDHRKFGATFVTFIKKN